MCEVVAVPLGPAADRGAVLSFAAPLRAGHRCRGDAGEERLEMAAAGGVVALDDDRGGQPRHGAAVGLAQGDGAGTQLPGRDRAELGDEPVGVEFVGIVIAEHQCDALHDGAVKGVDAAAKSAGEHDQDVV